MSHSDLKQCLDNSDVASSLRDIVLALADVCCEISSEVSRAGLSDILGSANEVNIQGETQKKLDIISNELIKNALANVDSVKAIASEEEEEVVPSSSSGKYVVAFDPLDGSSNIDINGQIGTIFTILPAVSGADANDPAHFLQKGREQVCAGYVLYGPATLLAITFGDGTLLLTLDRQTKSFLLTEANMSIPHDTAEFAVNISNTRFWGAAFNKYIAELLQGEKGVRNKRFNMRWNGAMVGDVHRVLSRGGVFLYPSDSKNPQQPAKLRLLYEANPMAMLVENAQGAASTESDRILDLQPQELHQRVAVIIGSKNEVAYCTRMLKES